jgi:phosphatidylglycerol---prolipoprotein diacylglyceryl transferase
VHPNLFSVFGHDVSGYMLLIAVGFIFATAMGALWVKRVGQNPDVVVDLGLAAVVAGLVGARLLHVVADGYFWDYVHLCTDPSRVSWPVLRSECLGRLDGVWDAQASVCHPKQADCWAWAQIWGGGLTFYGGFFAAALAAWWLFRRDRFPFWKGLDMGGMMVPIGLGLGRLGCVLVGCCFGKACDRSWALAFPSHSPASEWQFRQHLLESPYEVSLPVHPTQLYESFAALAIAAVCILFVQGRKRYDGQVFVVFVVLYALGRFVIEFWRSDDRGGFASLSTSQWLGLGMLLLAAVIHFGRGARRARSLPARLVTDDPVA